MRVAFSTLGPPSSGHPRMPRYPLPSASIVSNCARNLGWNPFSMDVPLVGWEITEWWTEGYMMDHWSSPPRGDYRSPGSSCERGAVYAAEACDFCGRE